MTRFGIDVSSTKLLTTFPAPRLATTGSNEEIICTTRKSTRKNVITRIVLETPPLTPGTLLGVHLRWGMKKLKVSYTFIRFVRASLSFHLPLLSLNFLKCPLLSSVFLTVFI
jgi:hypothetical protein